MTDAGEHVTWHVKRISDQRVDYWYDQLVVWHLEVSDGCLVQKSFTEGKSLTVNDGTILYCIPLKSFHDSVRTEDAMFVDEGTESWVSDPQWDTVLHVRVTRTAVGSPEGTFIIDRYYAPNVGLVKQTETKDGSDKVNTLARVSTSSSR